MDRNIEIGVKTTLADGRVEQTIDGLTKRIVDIAAQHQEAAVRAALIQLGWIPPEQAEEWRRDAERWQWSVANARWLRHEHEAYVAIPVALGANLSCLASRVAAIDAARKEGV